MQYRGEEGAEKNEWRGGERVERRKKSIYIREREERRKRSEEKRKWRGKE